MGKGIRIISKTSANMVYHRPECKFAEKIYKRNRDQMSWIDAERKGYRPCKFCGGAKFLYKLHLKGIENYAKIYNLDIDLKDNIIYVRTDAGCWKLVYSIWNQQFTLFHRNRVDGRISLDEVDEIPFHRQRDMPESGSITKYLHYIKEHDNFKMNGPADYRKMPRDTKRQKKYYNSAKRRAERKEYKRLDMLFLQIESEQNLKPVSIC